MVRNCLIMNRIKLIFFSVALIVAARASAQTKEISHDFSHFNSLSVSDGFQISLVKSNSYAATIYVDGPLAEFVEAYVRGKVLHINFNEKAVPKETKKLYKGKNALTSSFRATVYLPDLESIELTDGASLAATDEFDASRFTVNLTDKASIKSLNIRCNTAEIDLKKNSNASLRIQADNKISAVTEGNALLKVAGTAADFSADSAGSSSLTGEVRATASVTLSSTGSSNMKISTDTDRVFIVTSRSSKLAITGSATNATIKGSNVSSIDANNFPVVEADVVLSGSSRANVNASELLGVSLTDGSSLYFSGSPQFRITKIIRSTLAPYGTK